MKILPSSICSLFLVAFVFSSLGCMMRTRNGDLTIGFVPYEERWHYDHDHDDNWRNSHPWHDERWHYDNDYDENWRHDHPWHSGVLVVVHDERWHYDHDHDDDWRNDHPWQDR